MFEQKVLFTVDFLSVTSDLRVQYPKGGARGQNLGHLRLFVFFCFYFSCIESFNLNYMCRIGYFSL